MTPTPIAASNQPSADKPKPKAEPQAAAGAVQSNKSRKNNRPFRSTIQIEHLKEMCGLDLRSHTIKLEMGRNS